MRPAYLTADISPGGCGSASLHSLVPQPWVPKHPCRAEGRELVPKPTLGASVSPLPFKNWDSFPWLAAAAWGWPGLEKCPQPRPPPQPSTSHQLPEPEAISLQFNSFRCIFLQELVWAPSATCAFIHTGASCWDLMLGAGESKWPWWDWETWGASMGVISLQPNTTQGHAGDY